MYTKQYESDRSEVPPTVSALEHVMGVVKLCAIAVGAPILGNFVWNDIVLGVGTLVVGKPYK